MSAEQSHEDLKAGGEGEEVAEPEKRNLPAKLTVGRDEAAKTESLGSKIVSLNGVQNGSATAVKDGSDSALKNGLVNGVKNVSTTGIKSVSATAVASVSVNSVTNSSTTALKSVSVNRVKNGSITAVKSSSGIESRLGSVEREDSILSKAEEVLEAESSKTEMADLSKMSVRKETATKVSEEKLGKFLKGRAVPAIIVEEAEEDLGGPAASVASSAARVPASIESMEPREMVDFSRQVLSRIQQSFSFDEVTSTKPSSIGHSDLWSTGTGNQVSRMMSNVIESVAMSHAAFLAESMRNFEFAGSRRGTTFGEVMVPQESKVQRSVWRDPDVLDVIGKMRLDALGENVISSRENSEEILPEGLMTQFDIDEEVEEKHEKVGGQLMSPKDDVHSIIVEMSPTGSVITSFWPVDISLDIPLDKALSDDITTASTEEQQLPEMEFLKETSELTSLPAVAPVPKPVEQREPCDVSKLTCFSQKDEISSEELSICSSRIRSQVEVAPSDVHVKFRLVTSQVLKRIYRRDTVFRETVCDLSQMLCVAPETVQLSIRNESVDLDANVWDVCQRGEAEVLVDADFCPEQLFCLVKKGVLVFDDDEALDRFLLRRVPCVPEKKTRPVRPAAEAKAVPHPSSFIPGLVDHRERDGAISAALERRLDLAKCVRCIQTSFRCYLSKRTFARARRKEHSPQQQPIEASPVDEASCKRNALMKDVNLLTKEDFTVLYSLLREWWQHEADAIKRNNSSAAKKARLFKLHLTEIDYMRDIEMHRWKLKEGRSKARIWELVEKVEEWESFTLWQRVELLQAVACTLCQRLNCENCAGDKKAIRAAISRDMNAIIEGKHARSGNAACQRYCYTCHRSLPIWSFKPSTEGARLYSCEKCQGLANLGRQRRDVRILMEGVRRGESLRGGCSWLPYIMQEQDFATLAELWHNVSAVSGAPCGLRWVRWDPLEEWSPWNTVLLTREEAAAHRIDAYARDFVDTVRKRHLTAKWTFRNLIELVKSTRRK